MPRLAPFLAGLAAAATLSAPQAGAAPPVDHPLDTGDPRPRLETAVAVDPRDPAHVVVGALQMTGPALAAAANGYYPSARTWVSPDGGGSFEAGRLLPQLDDTSPASNDLTLAWDPHGSLYASFTAFGAQSTSGPPDPREGVYVARSRDGRHWTRLGRVEGFHCEGPDRSTVAVDPVRGWLYITWIHYAVAADCSTIDFARSTLRWARSTDHGAHWGSPVEVTAPGVGQLIAPAVTRDGTLVVAYLDETNTTRVAPDCGGQAGTLMAARWDVHGRSLGAVPVLPDLCEDFADLSPNGADYYLSTFPALAADPATGRVVIAVSYTGARQGVMTSSSGDGGRTWTHSLVSGLPGTTATLPALGQGAGRFALTFLEVGPAGLYRPLLASSADGGRSWTTPASLVDVPSVGDLKPYGATDNYRIGHYMGVAVGSDRVAHAAWPDLRPRAGTGAADVDVRVKAMPLP